MTLALMILTAQTLAVFFLTAWLTIGVFENMFQPNLNRVYTSEVMDMTRMRDEYPEAYAEVAYRRVSDPFWQRFLFRVIVTWELLATIALWVGVVAMARVILGGLDIDTGRMFAVLGVMMFTATWSGFLVVGNWFCYWFSHEGGQNTHFQMTLWGLATMIFLVVA